MQGSEQPVGNIAFALGFDELNSFYRFFRRETGTTPTVYRNHTLLPIS
ncbi:MAG: helix-turn-helix domain-containing protein [Bacteroidales bacterium]|nr:helix-turn-helix domain-containing protein [Bacteroidales bacterium]